MTSGGGLGLKSWLAGPKRESKQIPSETQAVLDSSRIAVLPFASTSPDPNDAYLADGITDDIRSTVMGISGLSVISRTSVMGYKGTAKKIEEIGRELRVGSILEGSFKKVGNRIRVTAQLIDVANDKNIWTQIYDRELNDVLAVQSDLATQVADALKVRILSPEKKRIEKKPSANATAYTLYLKGRYLWNKRGLDDIRKAVELFNEAIGQDPSFALAFVGLADCFLILRSQWQLDLEANYEKAKTMLGKALDLDHALPEAHATMGNLLKADYRLREAEERFKKAIELRPSYSLAHVWYYGILAFQLRWDEALYEIEKAVELDPLSTVSNANHAGYYYARREYGKSLELFKRVIELDIHFAPAYWTMAWINGRMDKFDDANRDFETAIELTQGSFPLVRKSAEAVTAYLRNDLETVKRLLPEMEANLQDAQVDASLIAGLYFFLRDFDTGFQWLEKSYCKREYGLLGIRYVDLFDGVRSDPRYLDLLKRLKLEDTGSGNRSSTNLSIPIGKENT